MMHLNDLMIGDWVKHTYLHWKTGEPIIRIFRISRIENELGKYYVWANEPDCSGRMCHPEKLEPLLLTPEILTHNGWKWDGMYATLIHNDDMKMSWYKHEGIVRDYYHDNLIFLSRPGIVYIHQLQHILNMCGIDKEILL